MPFAEWLLLFMRRRVPITHAWSLAQNKWPHCLSMSNRGQWREIAPVSALVKPVSLLLRVDSGLQVSVEEEQGIQPCLPGCHHASHHDDNGLNL